MNKKVILTVVLLLVVAGGGFFFLSSKTKNSSTSVSENNIAAVDTVAKEASPSSEPTIKPSSSPASAVVVKEFTIDGSNFSFVPKEIKVSKGDTVKITFKDLDGMHNLVVDGYNVKTNIIKGGTQDSITFLADKVGQFEYYCSVGNHKESGMVGAFIVE